MTHPKMLTVAEVAARVRVSKMTVYRLVHTGELSAIRVGRSLRIPEPAVDAYLERPPAAQPSVFAVPYITTQLGAKVIDEAVKIVAEWDLNAETMVPVDEFARAVHLFLNEQASIAETADILADPDTMAAIAEAEAELS